MHVLRRPVSAARRLVVSLTTRGRPRNRRSEEWWDITERGAGMSVAKGRSAKTAFDLVVSYTRTGDDRQAARVYAESRLSHRKYMEALALGRAQRQIECHAPWPKEADGD